MRFWLVVGLFLVLTTSSFLAGCYPKGVGPVGLDGRQLAWPEMNIEQRQAHMRDMVIPRAGAVFRSWRPERFEKIDCRLCHGNAENSGNFEMPTDHLPRLSGALLLGPERGKFPETTQLKLDRLVPEMADALGLKTFRLITRRGFGCYSCHLGPEGPVFGN